HVLAILMRAVGARIDTEQRDDPTDPPRLLTKLAQYALDEGLVTIQKAAWQPPLTAFRDMLGTLDQQQAAVAVHDCVNDDMPERHRQTVLESAGDHSGLTG